MRKYTIATFLILFAIASCTKKSAPTSTTASADGAGIFSKNCARCHGAQGVKDERTPNLQTIALNKSQLVNSITNGKTTEGKKERMPAFKDKLSTAEISAVADLIVGWHKK